MFYLIIPKHDDYLTLEHLEPACQKTLFKKFSCKAKDHNHSHNMSLTEDYKMLVVMILAWRNHFY